MYLTSKDINPEKRLQFDEVNQFCHQLYRVSQQWYVVRDPFLGYPELAGLVEKAKPIISKMFSLLLDYGHPSPENKSHQSQKPPPG